MKTFAEQLTAARKAAGLTQEELSRRIHVTRATISHWEVGRYVPDFNTIQLLSKELNCSFMINDNEAPEAAAAPEEAPEEAAGQPLPDGNPSPRVTPKQLLILAVIALVIVSGLYLLIRPALMKKAGAVPSDTGSGLIYRIQDYQTVAPRNPGQAYIVVDTATSTVNGENATFWMYTFTLREDNGLAFHIDRMENIWFRKGNAHPFVFSDQDLNAANMDPDIPARGQFSFDGGMPLDQHNMTGVGLKVEGHDENGAVLVFTGYIPFPQP